MRTRLLAATVVATAFVLTGCATPAGTSPVPPIPRLGDVAPALPSGEVVSGGMVIDVAGDAALCLFLVGSPSRRSVFIRSP